MITSWHTYPSIFAMGHRYIVDLLKSDVLVEEKVDGSQLSFGLVPAKTPLVVGPGYIEGQYDLRIRSKGAELNTVAPEKMFIKAVEWITTNAHRLTPGWTYRGEYLAKPKHNVLAYDRHPANHIILFDINPGEEEYLSYDVKRAEAERLGLETVPRMFEGRVETLEQFREYLSRESVLGGQKIEGVVVKNYALFGPDKKVMMGKFVSEEFKEVHAKSWKAENPGSADIVQRLVEKYHGPARWQKALIHLREQGKIEGTPADIRWLMAEVWPDVEKEEKEAIKDALYAWACDKIRRGVTHGLPEWYKEQLLKQQFETESQP